MNVLILTPDAVGSTLLQRLITIYMQFCEYDQPVINLHELTNGLEKYYSSDFNREIVSKKKVQDWGYHQSLQQIVELLNSVDHYKTSRLAHYHIKNRGDTLEQQIPFYRYLDKNFFVIACRRHNIFEHALSMAINGITKKLNVYSHVEKINTFVNMENIEIDERAFKNQLEAYKNYLDWSSNFFNASSYFYYDEHLSNIEQYILKLPIWPGVQPCVTWHEKFGITFNDWNRCHHIPSDFSTLLNLDNLRQLLELGTPLVTKETVEFYQNHASPDWPTVSCPEDFHKLPAKIKNEMQGHENFKVAHLISAQPSSARQFLQYNSEAYQNAKVAIQRMQELDIIVSPPPIKKHTLAEKLSLISNKDQCLDLYNSWIQNHPEIGAAISQQDLDLQIEQERSFWTPFIYPEVSSSTRPSNEVLGYQNGSNL